MSITHNTNHSRAVLLLIITAILWSAGGLLIKLIEWNSVAIAGGRSFFAAIVLLVYLRKPQFTWSKDQIYAAVAYACCCGLFVVATKLTTAANAIVLQYTGPIYVALLSGWLLHERITRLDWLTIVIVLGGMVLFFADGLSMQGLLGNIIAIISGISFAFLAIFLRKQKDNSPTESLLLGNILIFLCAIPAMVSVTSSGPDTVPFTNGLTYISLGWLSILGIFQLGFPYILYGKAIRHVSALEATLLPVLEPLLNPIWVVIIMQEQPTLLSVIGGTIVIGAITLRGIILSRRITSAQKYSMQ